MADGTLTYSNPTAFRPDPQVLPPFLQGTEYAGNRRMFEDQVSLQELMQQMGAQRTMATQPSAIGADVAKNQATALTAVPEAMYKTEGLRLGNVERAGTIQTNDLERTIKERGEAINNMQRGLQMASLLRSVAGQGNPAALAAVRERLGQGTDEVSRFISSATDNKDLMGRIDHVMGVYKSLSMDYQKALLDLQRARITAGASSQPNPWMEHVRIATRRIQRENPGMSAQEAEERASMEVRALQSGEGGIKRPAPEVQGQAAAFEQFGKLKALYSAFPNTKFSREALENIKKMEDELRQQVEGKEGQRKTPKPADVPQAVWDEMKPEERALWNK